MRRLIFAVLVGGLGAALLLWLGAWQIQRLAWKTDVLEKIEAKLAADSVVIPATPNPEEHSYLSVHARGVIGDEELFVLVSQRGIGAGYRVISPFAIDSGRRLLLDRGFIPAARRDATRRSGPAKIQGNLHWPDDRNRSTPDNDEAGNVWFARDIEDMARRLNTEPVLVVLRETSQDRPGVSPLPVDTRAIPNNHLQYAITWFALAAIWVGMTAFYLWRGRHRMET